MDFAIKDTDVRASLRRNGHLIGWLIQVGDGRLLMQPGPADPQFLAQGGTPERWRHYALQMLRREGYFATPRTPETFAAHVAGEPALTAESEQSPLPPGLPEPQEFRAADPEGDDPRADAPVDYARADLRERLEAANAAVHPEPTEGQARAGNYRHGHVTVHGVPVAIEVATGGVRRGKDRQGKEWARTLPCAYGRIKRSEGADGEQVDVFLGPHPESELVYVVDQVTPGGRFDESKAVLGCRNEAEARKLYLGCYEPGWHGLGAIRALTLDDFKRWLEEGDKAKRVADWKG